MAHFLRKSETHGRPLGKPWAAVRMKVVKKQPTTLQMDPDPDNPIFVLAHDVAIAKLPERVILLDQDGEEFSHDTASGRYYVTLETFDPIHAVLDFR